MLAVALGPAVGAAVPETSPPSLFRSLLGPDQVVPFPIDRLLARIGRELAAEAPFDGLPVVLIPLGRSLQRHAAGDADYFRYPRVVVAVTGEPRDASAPLLRDRLYLGYHEKAGVLEVISYNPGHGRFEFEVVDDYRAGGVPRVRAGNRSLCLACHQNHAPLFPRQTWDETSASRRIATLLDLTGKDYYGLPWRRGVDVANAIDDATDRANLLSVAQRIWQTGCGPDPAGIDCRAELWWLAVRGRFTGLPPDDAEFASPALAPLRQWWAGLAGGLAVPNPDIPNRLPFAALSPEGLAHLDEAALRRAADVGARFDALVVRPPLAHWMADEPGALARAVAAVGGYLSDAEVRALLARPRGTGRVAMTETLHCDRQARGAREDLRCWSGDTLRVAARRTGGRLWIDRLVLPGGMVRYGLEFVADADGYAGRGALARTSKGLSLGRLRLDGARLELVMSDDLAPLQASIRTLAARNRAGDGLALAQGVLRRHATLAPLLVDAGLAPPPAIVPLPSLDERVSTGGGVMAPDLSVFYRRCGACHGAGEAFPPGFLHGPEEEVRGRLDACAPRIWRRLQAWSHAPATRTKTPMPPPASAQAGGFAGSTEFEAMQRFLEDRLRAQGQAPGRVAAVAYADLPACATY